MQDRKEVMPNVTEDGLLTVPEVAGLLRTTNRNVREWTRTGKLAAAGKAGREWRYRRSDVEEYLQQGLAGD